mgnify:FL=1
MITYYVRPAIRDQFAEMIRNVCPDAKPVEYAHESDMGGASVTPAALHRYFDRITVDAKYAAFIVDRETGSAHDPFDRDQESVRAWTQHISDLLAVCENRITGTPYAASLMCMLPANARFASPDNWREAVRRQARMGMFEYGSAHHIQIFADNENTAGLWMHDDFDRCADKIKMGELPDWPFFCQLCPCTKERRLPSGQMIPGAMHMPGVLAKNIEHVLKSGLATPQLWWPHEDLGDPAIRYMIDEIASVVGRRDRVPVGGGVG